jgi:hypothetical protein
VDADDDVPRPTGFDPQDYPRTRSYPGSDEYLDEVREKPGAGARFAGRLAAIYGADRERLGSHPTRDNVDALVRKAIILLRSAVHGVECADAVFVLDPGAKAEAVHGYVAESPRELTIAVRSLRDKEPARIQLTLRGRVADAAECAVAALPPEMGLDRVGRVLIADVGYSRTKLAIMSERGCEHQQDCQGLGVSDCVRRILRDGQEQGLVEDEFAVIQGLERSQSTIEVAGRRFDLTSTLVSATRSLEEELLRAVARVVLDHYGRYGEPCHGVAITGGGAAIVGAGLADRVRASDLGVNLVWVANDTSYLLLEGAARIAGIPVRTTASDR